MPLESASAATSGLERSNISSSCRYRETDVYDVSILLRGQLLARKNAARVLTVPVRYNIFIR